MPKLADPIRYSPKLEASLKDLIAVFPANIYMAMNPIQAGAASIPPILLWGRLPLQVFFIWWVLWCSRPHQSAR